VTVTQLRVIITTVASVAVAVSILLVQALRQRSLDQLHPLALTVLGLCALTLAGGYAVVDRALVRSRRRANPGPFR